IEGGRLETFAPTDVGPLDEQMDNGVVDVAVPDETATVAVAKNYLAYFDPEPVGTWAAPDPDVARNVVPENRRQAYDVHAALDAVIDVGSALELRAGFAPGI